MSKIAIIYSFNTNRTAESARKIAAEMTNEIEQVNVETMTDDQFLLYDRMILGVPTWFDGELPNYWDEFLPALEDMDLKGKKIALFGTGDQKSYAENFVDAIGIMAELLEKQGAKIIGYTSVKGYEFEDSKAVRGEQFVGLAIDYENQASQIDGKIKKWTEKLKKEFNRK